MNTAPPTNGPCSICAFYVHQERGRGLCIFTGERPKKDAWMPLCNGFHVTPNQKEKEHAS